MADVNNPRVPRSLVRAPSGGVGQDAATEGGSQGEDGQLDYELIELLFFAYREFVGVADQELERIGFGRAHHRVLYFVDRRPGLTVAELLEILSITKQSLARVLKQLVDEGYIAQEPGPLDRRQRLLSTTPKGRDLVARLSANQSGRIEQALAHCAPETRRHAVDFLRQMVTAGPRETDKGAAMPDLD